MKKIRDYPLDIHPRTLLHKSLQILINPYLSAVGAAYTRTRVDSSNIAEPIIHFS